MIWKILKLVFVSTFWEISSMKLDTIMFGNFLGIGIYRLINFAGLMDNIFEYFLFTALLALVFFLSRPSERFGRGAK